MPFNIFNFSYILRNTSFMQFPIELLDCNPTQWQILSIINWHWQYKVQNILISCKKLWETSWCVGLCQFLSNCVLNHWQFMFIISFVHSWEWMKIIIGHRHVIISWIMVVGASKYSDKTSAKSYLKCFAPSKFAVIVQCNIYHEKMS